MVNTRQDRRKDKRVSNFLHRTCAFGKYATGCRGHPGIVVSTCYTPGDIWGSSLEIRSLIDGEVEACSLRHCGVWPMKKEVALEQAAYWRKHGKAAWLVKYEYEYVEELIDTWHKIPEDADPQKVWGAGMSIIEFLQMTEDEYYRLVVRLELPE